MKEMKKKITLLINVCFLSLMIIGFYTLRPIKVFADENADGIGFSIAPVLPSTQIDKNLGYYYLETKPNEEQYFEVKISSQEEKKQTIQMLVQDAYTASNGTLDYGIDGVDKFIQDETLKNPTSEVVKPVVEKIDLEPGEEKVVSFKVTPPNESYDGVKIGRLIFKKETDDDKSSGLIEEYQYGVSILLSENGDNHNDGDIKKILLNDVKATIKRGKRLVTANVQNTEAKRIINLDLTATITKKGEDKVIKKTHIPDFQFAPNSNVDLEVDWGLSEIEPGEYTINISGENEYDEMHLIKDFRITDEDAKKINKESAFKIKTPTWVKLIAIAMGILSFCVSLFILLRNRKWLKLLEKRKRNKKRNKKNKGRG